MVAVADLLDQAVAVVVGEAGLGHQAGRIVLGDAGHQAIGGIGVFELEDRRALEDLVMHEVAAAGVIVAVEDLQAAGITDAEKAVGRVVTV